MSRMYLFEGKVTKLEKKVEEIQGDLANHRESIDTNYYALDERIKVLEKLNSPGKSRVNKPGGK